MGTPGICSRGRSMVAACSRCKAHSVWWWWWWWCSHGCCRHNLTPRGMARDTEAREAQRLFTIGKQRQQPAVPTVTLRPIVCNHCHRAVFVLLHPMPIHNACMHACMCHHSAYAGRLESQCLSPPMSRRRQHIAASFKAVPAAHTNT